MEIEQDDIVLCTVEKISGTTVFVMIEDTNKTGSIVFSEISPGRIRNIRDFVVPKKTIVCKVLKINPNNLELSLRRVKEKEKKEKMEEYKLEKSYLSILKSSLKEKAPEIIKKIKEKNTIYDFLESSKKDDKELKKLVGDEISKKIKNILKNQKTKKSIIKKVIEFNTFVPEGIKIINEVFSDNKDIEIKYIAAGRYSLKKEDSDLKKADLELKNFISQIEKKLKTFGIDFTEKRT